VDEKRSGILVELERIVGNQCYNGNIQNYGPGGVWEGEGRSFRYPLTFLVDGKKTKHLSPIKTPPDVLLTGYYAFGANQLHVVRALDKVLVCLETKYGLKLVDRI